MTMSKIQGKTKIITCSKVIHYLQEGLLKGFFAKKKD